MGDAADDVFNARSAQNEELDLALRNIVDACPLATCRVSQTLKRTEEAGCFACGQCGYEFEV